MQCKIRLLHSPNSGDKTVLVYKPTEMETKTSRWGRSILCLSYALVLAAGFRSDLRAQSDAAPGRYEIKLEYDRPTRNPGLEIRGFKHAVFLSGRIPFDHRFAVRSEISFVLTTAAPFRHVDSETRLGSIYAEGEYLSKRNTIRLGIHIPIESNNLGFNNAPNVDDRRLDVFRPGVGSVVFYLMRAPYERRLIGIAGGVGLIALFGDLNETERWLWVTAETELILAAGPLTAKAGVVMQIPLTNSSGGGWLPGWRFQPEASMRIDGERVSPGLFVRHPGFTDSSWVVGAEVCVFVF